MSEFWGLDNFFQSYPDSPQSGAPSMNRGAAPVMAWMVQQSFAGAGPVGAYFSCLFGNTDPWLPRVTWGTQSARSFVHGAIQSEGTRRHGRDGASRSSSPLEWMGEPRPQRGTGGGGTSGSDSSAELQTGQSAPIDQVFVFGSPRETSSRASGSEARWLTPTQMSSVAHPENWLDLGPSAQTLLRRQPRATTTPKGSPARAGPAPELPPLPPPTPVEPAQERGVLTAVTPAAENEALLRNPLVTPGPTSAGPSSGESSPFGRSAEPAGANLSRPELYGARRIEHVPTVQPERTFWSRGGTGLLVGGAAAAGAVAVLFFWNPVGWAAGATALALAGGVAATMASSVQLGASYGGLTDLRQDAALSRSVDATLAFSSVGGALGGPMGALLADDPVEGFEQGAAWGGLTEVGAGVAMSLPAMLRSVPGLGRVGAPWARSLALTPLWFAMGTGGGGGRVRSVPRTFLAQGRLARRVRSVEHLGTTPMLQVEPPWAQYQIAQTGSRSESVFRIVYATGEERLVLADRGYVLSRINIHEAKLGDMGQMFLADREAHIIAQAQSYIDITTVGGGRVTYHVSERLGVQRLTQRFTLDFPAELASGQLRIQWAPWRP